MLKLSKMVSPNDIGLLEKEINRLRNKQFSISIEKTDLLAYSIEDQLLAHVNSYVTWLVLEKFKIENTDFDAEEKWIRVYDKYEDFLKSEEDELIQKAFYYINRLIYQPESE